MPTISQALAEGSRVLEDAGIPEPRRTAATLFMFASGLDRAQVIARSNEDVDEQALAGFREAVKRRGTGEPLQYITGQQEFFGLGFRVTPAVLIPRPETEFLVEQVIRLASGPDARDDQSPVIVDVGTGSGCIAVSLAVKLPRARILAADISAAALEVARDNARAHSVSDRIEFLDGDLLSPLDRLGRGREVDIIASNPPYVPEESMATLQREVRDWEPRIALEAGEKGLDYYSRLLREAIKYLRPGGALVVELGYSQLEAILAMVDRFNWDVEDVTADLQGIPRTLTLRRKNT